MIKKTFLLILISFIFSKKVLAVCPVCTVAVGAGIGLSRWLGIDDVISGIWIGGLTTSMIMWNINWFDKKNIHFKGRIIITTLAYFILIIVPLYFMKDIWHPMNVLWGINKLLLGILLGAIFCLGGTKYYEYLKNKNGGKARFPFQKVAMPVIPLIVLSLIFYFITK